jgi:hypothetical protein
MSDHDDYGDFNIYFHQIHDESVDALSRILSKPVLETSFHKIILFLLLNYYLFISLTVQLAILSKSLSFQALIF